MWAIGTEVECIEGSDWIDREEIGAGAFSGPKLGEICVVSGAREYTDGVYIEVRGHPHEYHSCYFRPITDRKLPECLTELLKNPHREIEPA